MIKYEGREYEEVYFDTWINRDTMNTISKGKYNRYYLRSKGKDSEPILLNKDEIQGLT